jgi:hypothetical protein
MSSLAFIAYFLYFRNFGIESVKCEQKKNYFGVLLFNNFVRPKFPSGFKFIMDSRVDNKRVLPKFLLLFFNFFVFIRYFHDKN